MIAQMFIFKTFKQNGSKYRKEFRMGKGRILANVEVKFKGSWPESAHRPEEEEPQL